ncbi:MAG: T9SS type A sorting domain-containing protein, partial [Imperialibacter sp.]|uniref:T9SS type A sorting domain-containing protein n=1 Tax=Imperialibacter sp. TaxID=2038411 RepID=UPI0032ED9D38
NGINDEDGFYIDNVIVREPPVTYATLPFEDNFDDGTMKSPWAWVQPDSTVTDLNTIIPSADYGLTSGANSNSFWVFMGKLCDNNAFATNALDLHLNLSGQSEVELVFDINSFFDETHAEDGIYFSEDGGNNFIKVIDWDPESWTDNTWFTHPSVNVGLLAIQNGLQLTDRFVIRFQQHDNADFNGTNDEDGIRIDNVFVRNSKLPYITAFTPGIGPVDREVTISGGNFANTQEVLFNEIKADTFIVVDSATLIVKVPAGAETGKISVTNEEGTTSSENDFVVSTEEVAAPYELSAEAVSCFITLNWQDTTGNETGFIVERRMVDSTDFTQIATLGANSTSYADEARVLQNGTEYFYRVRAFSPLGNSAYSNEASATAIVSDNCGGEPPTAPPPAPTGLVASTPDREETQLDLNWNVVEGATSYNVYRQVGGNFEQVGSTTETSYTDRGLAFGTIYIYHVRAYNGRESDPSDTASATTIDKILAIGDDLAEVSELLRLYPNPAQGQLQFTLKNDEYSEVQLRVFNTLGQVQLDQSFIKNQPVIEDAMDISHWKSGMYFVEITQGQFRTVQRVAKQ